MNITITTELRIATIHWTRATNNNDNELQLTATAKYTLWTKDTYRTQEKYLKRERLYKGEQREEEEEDNEEEEFEVCVVFLQSRFPFLSNASVLGLYCKPHHTSSASTSQHQQLAKQQQEEQL